MPVARRMFVAVVVSTLMSGFYRRSAAQVAVEVGPVLGYYLPKQTDGPDSPGNYSGLALGAEGTVRFPHRVGVRADAMVVSKGESDVTNPGGWQGSLAGRVSAVNLLGTLDIVRDETQSLWLGAGPGIIHHGGDAFASAGNPTNGTAVFAIGESVGLSKSLILSGGASGLFYRYGGIFGPIGGPPFPSGPRTGYFARRFQRDLVIYGVLAWRNR